MARRAPAGIVALLLAALAAQCTLHAVAPPPATTGGAVLPAAPPVAALRLASLGDGPAAARLVLLYLHAFDAGMPLRELDYDRVAGWLEAALALDPRSRQPLVAAQVYAAVADPGRVRTMLDFVERAFAADPAQRWPEMAQATLVARHRLHDMALARRYAQAIRLRAPAAPAWARQLELFILQDMNELDSARAVAGALLAGGTITDPAEVRFLERRLQELEHAAECAAECEPHRSSGQVR